jgi:formate dehydrogenase subunit delta
METRDMVRMANQIGGFFKSYSDAESLEGISDHINKFWEPRMRRDLFALLDAGGEGLHENVKLAAVKIKRPKVAQVFA